MGKTSSVTVSQARRRRGAAVLALLACLLIAGCAPRDGSAEKDRPGGFYGGVSTGSDM